MTREQKIAKAKELRDQGLMYREIAERLGVSTSTVYRWLNPERVAPYRNGRALNPERARANDRDYYRRRRVGCPECGGKMTLATARRGGKCKACREDEADRRARQIVAWWAEGLSISDICDRLGWSRNRLSMEMYRLREKGYDLPYRYTEGRRAGRRFPDQVPA